jgi:hypothetical protein
MQRTMLKPHDFDRNLDMQNALTERSVADEIQLEPECSEKLVFIQNRLSRHIS